MLLSLRDGLRCGDVFVPGSRRYADPTTSLLTEEQWRSRRVEYCQLVGKPPDAGTAIAAATEELHTALADLDARLAVGQPGQVRLNDDGELIIPEVSLTELVLAATGAGKVKFMRLLEDAHHRQVLRQTGAVYQFRHAELQDHLAEIHRRHTRPPTST